MHWLWTAGAVHGFTCDSQCTAVIWWSTERLQIPEVHKLAACVSHGWKAFSILSAEGDGKSMHVLAQQSGQHCTARWEYEYYTELRTCKKLRINKSCTSM